MANKVPYVNDAGLFPADLESRLRSSAAGHVKDEIESTGSPIATALSAAIVDEETFGVASAEAANAFVGRANTLTNPDFSNGITGWTNETGTIPAIQPVGRGGKNAAVLSGSRLMTSSWVPATSGSAWRIDVTYRTVESTGTATGGVYLQRRHTSGATSLFTSEKMPATGGAWSTFTIEAAAPVSSNAVRAYVSSSTGLTYYIDNISVRPAVPIGVRLGGLSATINTTQGAPVEWAVDPNQTILKEAMVAGSGLPSIYWPWVIPTVAITAPLGKYYMYWSTDHSTAAGGIAMAYANAPTGPWTVHGTVFTYAATNSHSTETPSVLVRGTGDLIMYFHNREYGSGNVQEKQITAYATSTDGVTWARQGYALEYPESLPGDGHSGYARPFEIGIDGYVMYSLAGGTAYPRQAIWYSRDGINWVLDRRTFANQVDISGSMLSAVDMRLSVFRWHGDLWAGVMIQGASYVGRLRDDLRGFKGRMYQTNFIPETVIVGMDGKLYGYRQNATGITVATLEA